MQQPAPVNISVSHYVCPSDMTLLTFLDQIVDAGFTSVGLTVRALDEMPVSQIRQALQVRGLGVSSVNTAGYFFEANEAATKQTALNQRLLDAAAELEAANGVNLIVGSSALLPLTQIRDQALEQAGELAAMAKARGTRLLLEPMHPLQALGRRFAGSWRFQGPKAPPGVKPPKGTIGSELLPDAPPRVPMRSSATSLLKRTFLSFGLRSF
mgnify:CR=1 FL=1